MSQMLIEDVLNCPSLPTLPAVAAKLIELTADPDVQISEIAKVVQQDQALAVKVLKTVNSSYYGLSNKCGSIDRAMGYLGLNTVKSLVLGFSLVEVTSNSDHDGFDMIGHWRRTLLGATASRSIAENFKLSDKDDVFTAALFQDMGMLATFTAMKESYSDTIKGIDHAQVCPAETKSFGFTHEKVGAELARKWKLPDNISAAIAHHHHPDQATGGDMEMVRAVSLGTQVAEALSESSPAKAIQRIESQTATWFPNQKIDILALFEEVNESAKELATLFNTEIGDLKDVKLLMLQAQERGLEHQILMQRQTEDLEKQALTDGMTKIPNRKAFDNEVTKAFNEYKESGAAFAVLFFDADKFKSVNDTLGHAAGDAVLIELAKRAAKTVGDEGTVCRYGGEEFGVVLPGYSATKAAVLAECLRFDMNATPIDISEAGEAPGEILVSVSVGVSATDAGPADRLIKPEQMVIEADLGVYAAKEFGRNTVQIWTPEMGQSLQGGVAQCSTPAGAIPDGDGAVRKILLIEDDSLAATLVITLFNRKTDVEIQWIKDGERACGYFKECIDRSERPCDIVISDLNLPGCSGFDVFERFKEFGLDQHIEFYVLTASECDETMGRVESCGIAKCITKSDFTNNIGHWIKTLTQPISKAA